MARFLLIALLAVVAVAGPVAAQGLPALPDLETTAEDSFADVLDLSVTFACSTELCESPSGDCPPVKYGLTHRWPGFYVWLDPDNCTRGQIDCIMENGVVNCVFGEPPAEVPWPSLSPDDDVEDAADDPEPSASTQDPVPTSG